jgi:hypothetical protein
MLENIMKRSSCGGLGRAQVLAATVLVQCEVKRDAGRVAATGQKEDIS